MLAVGVFYYRLVEGWSVVDSLYFCVMTLATVGFGDLVPTTPGSKLFTIAYVIMGLSFFLSFVSLLTRDRSTSWFSRRKKFRRMTWRTVERASQRRTCGYRRIARSVVWRAYGTRLALCALNPLLDQTSVAASAARIGDGRLSWPSSSPSRMISRTPRS